MKKMLMLASVGSMIDQFNMLNIEILKKQGFEVHVAANFKNGNTSSKKRVEEFKKELDDLNVPFYQIDFSRKITDFLTNYKAYKQIKNLMQENNYNFVHCHSPIGGVCGRLAGYKTKTSVIYTAHGFHFFKGATLKNWLLYYPVERYLSRYTDVLITINHEDYNLAQKFKAKKVTYVHGVGVDTEKFRASTFDRQRKRAELGISKDTTVLLSVGEMIRRKNHETAIKAIAYLDIDDIVYLVCGRGELEEYLKDLAKSLGVEEKVKFLGFRGDITEICMASDVFIFPSFQEGLPVALMEAMSAGLPIVCSNIRGNCDLIVDGKGGYLVNPYDVNDFVYAIKKIYELEEQRDCFSKYNIELVRNFSKENVEQEMEGIYSVFL